MAKVRIGFFSFTEVTDPAEHRSYNEWHQLDHMPEQYPLAGVVYGQRWVSTPACRRARVFDSAELAPIHYMTLYLMGEPVDSTLEEFEALGVRLRADGRFHEHRRSRLSGPFAVTGMLAAPRVLVSPAAVPYRPNRGVYVVVRDGVDDTDAAHAEAFVAAESVAGVWTFATDERFEGLVWHPGVRTITVCYLDADPLEAAFELGRLVRATVDPRRRPALFAGPLETITPWRWDWFDEGS